MGKLKYENVLFCTDYSENADIGFIYAVECAIRHGAKLHILHVMDSLYRYLPSETTEVKDNDTSQVNTVTEELIETVQEKIKARYKQRLGWFKKIVWKVVVGVPFVEILRYAKENNVDVIVMGASGTSRTQQSNFMSTMVNVSARAKCQVIPVCNPEKRYTLNPGGV